MGCAGTVVYEGKCVRGRDVEILDCAGCGFKHVHPLPTEEQMLEYYKTEYFAHEKPDYANSSGTSSEYQKLVDDAKLVAVGIPREPIFKGISQKQVLDVGCGPAAPFLQHTMQNPNIKVNRSHNILIGMEPTVSKEREMYANDGWFVVQSWELLDRRWPGQKFDIIHLGFVMEHLVNPMAMLLKCKEHLNAGGALIIESPNDFNPLQMAIWDGKMAICSGLSVPWWVSTPDHLNYFTPYTMDVLLSRAGFGRQDHQTTYPVEHFLLAGLDYRVDETAKAAVRDRRAACQAAWQASQGGIYQFFAHGRTFWCVAKRKANAYL